MIPAFENSPACSLQRYRKVPDYFDYNDFSESQQTASAGRPYLCDFRHPPYSDNNLDVIAVGGRKTRASWGTFSERPRIQS